MEQVPYDAPDAVFTNLVGDRLQLAFPGITAAAPFEKDARLRAVAVMADKRSDVMPDVPTTNEPGYPGLVSGTWFGPLVPKNTPPEIHSKINEVIDTAIDTGLSQRADRHGLCAARRHERTVCYSLGYRYQGMGRSRQLLGREGRLNPSQSRRHVLA